MPSLGDAYTSAFSKKKPSAPPVPAVDLSAPIHVPSDTAASLPPPPTAEPGTGKLGKEVSSEALDALSTIQVLYMATSGNLMAEDFVRKLEHHLKSIVKACEGDKHWPEKYKAHFKEEEEEQPKAPQGPVAEGAGHVMSPRVRDITSPGRAVASPGGGDMDVDLTDGERLGNFDFAEEEDDDVADVLEARGLKAGLRGFLTNTTSPKKTAAGGNKNKSDVDIYNIINAEEKDTGSTKRKGLALGQALSHSVKTVLWNETAGNKTTKHAAPLFTQNRATDVTFHDVTFSFQEYAPVIFLSMREAFGIQNETFIKSMSELKGGQVGEGKSGMLFFSTADREFIVKTVTKNELKFLERELKSYYDYMVVNGATSLIPRFVGLYFLKLPDKPIVRLIVMNNVFKLPKHRTIELVEMYDLKGSLHTRYVNDEERFTGKVSVLKDLNFCNRHDGTDSHGKEMKAADGPCRAIYLGPIRKIELLANLQSDVEWLRQHNIMDYSLLLAVGYEVSADGAEPAPEPPNPHGGWQSAWSMDLGGVRGMNGDFTERAEVYYMGVIDILQEYNAKKRAEHTLKSFTADSTKISAVDPNFYAERFLAWMEAHVA